MMKVDLSEEASTSEITTKNYREHDIEEGHEAPFSHPRPKHSLCGSFLRRSNRGPILRWSNISMALMETKGTQSVVKKQILNEVWGEANPGETTAIMVRDLNDLRTM